MTGERGRGGGRCEEQQMVDKCAQRQRKETRSEVRVYNYIWERNRGRKERLEAGYNFVNHGLMRTVKL